MQKQLKTGLGEVRSEMGKQAQQVAAVELQLAEARAELARFSATDRDSWLVAEAQYLLRLANQRLVMAGDVAAAQLLLGSADNILRELGDIGLHDVRGAVAADLAAVRAVPKVDVEGIYLRLSALIEQADKLVIFELPEKEAQPAREVEDDWQQRLQRGYEEAATKLSDYIVIRRRDVPMEALMDPQWEGLVRQNLRMLLEQAQVALLSGNQTLYRESLERSQHWVKQFFDSDEAASRAMAQEISQLQGLTVAVELPDISRSLRALDQAMEQRLQQGGGE
jgi:uroporphyrin-3 C-methyltransferase